MFSIVPSPELKIEKKTKGEISFRQYFSIGRDIASCTTQSYVVCMIIILY